MSGFRDVPKYAPAGRQAGREGGRDTGRQAGRHRLYLGYTVILAETDDRVPHESKCMHILSISHCSKILFCKPEGVREDRRRIEKLPVEICARNWQRPYSRGSPPWPSPGPIPNLCDYVREFSATSCAAPTSSLFARNRKGRMW